MAIKSTHAEWMRIIGVAFAEGDAEEGAHNRDDELRRVIVASVMAQTNAGNTALLVSWLRHGQELIDLHKGGLCGQRGAYPADLELVVPQKLLTLIAALLTGEAKAKYRPGITAKNVSGKVIHALREGFKAQIKRGLGDDEHPADLAMRKKITADLKKAGWSRSYPEGTGGITEAARYLLILLLGTKYRPGALKENLKKTPRKKTGKS